MELLADSVSHQFFKNKSIAKKNSNVILQTKHNWTGHMQLNWTICLWAKNYNGVNKKSLRFKWVENSLVECFCNIH